MIASATGHRPNKLGKEYNLQGPYSDWIEKRMLEWLDKNKPEKIISGMALGVDQLWAECGIKRKIPVIAAIPCIGQDSMWPERAVYLYNQILKNPLVESKYVMLYPYEKGCMQKRNIWMVDNCDVLFAVWNGTPGGTANCIKYAEEIGKEIFRIDPSDLLMS